MPNHQEAPKDQNPRQLQLFTFYWLLRGCEGYPSLYNINGRVPKECADDR